MCSSDCGQEGPETVFQRQEFKKPWHPFFLSQTLSNLVREGKKVLLSFRLGLVSCPRRRIGCHPLWHTACDVPQTQRLRGLPLIFINSLRSLDIARHLCFVLVWSHHVSQWCVMTCFLDIPFITSAPTTLLLSKTMTQSVSCILNCCAQC